MSHKILALAVVLLFVSLAQADASIVCYSWTGSIAPGPGSSDPWDLGGQKPTSIKVLVDGNAVDQDPATNFALFVPLSFAFSIDGMTLNTVAVGMVRFFDSEIGISQAQVSYQGVIVMVLQRIVLPSTTFSVTDPGVPPVFDADTAVSTAVNGDPTGTYYYATQKGVDIASGTVIPEPATLFIWSFLGFLGFSTTFLWQHSKC